MIITASRRIQFAYGHRVMGHENKCAHLHGHNGVAIVTAQAALDAVGRVIDFSVLKERVGGWIDQHWDHGFLYHREDVAVVAALAEFEREARVDYGWQKRYAMDGNPTAENMARHLLESVGPAVLVGTGVRLVEVVLWETENCYARVAEQELSLIHEARKDYQEQ